MLNSCADFPSAHRSYSYAIRSVLIAFRVHISHDKHQRLVKLDHKLHVIGKPGQSKPSKTARPSKPDTGAPSHAQKHFDFNRTSPFNSGLDWLLKTTMDVEKRHRHKTSIYGTPLTADSLNAFNCSEQGSEGSSRTHSSATKTSSKGSS
jgi:hypothetical protein